MSSEGGTVLPTDGPNNVSNGRRETSLETTVQQQQQQQQLVQKGPKKLPNRMPFKMLKFVRNTCILALSVLSTYATLQRNRSPKVVDGPAAQPFFHLTPNSPVLDYFVGDMDRIVDNNNAQSADITLIMYYAPWSVAAQRARPQLEAVGRLFSDTASGVQIIAVNCWHARGGCRQHNTFRRWPTLIVYAGHARGVTYTGPLQAPYLVRFLQTVLYPIVITRWELFAAYDVVVVAHINVLPGSQTFSAYYTAALHYLEVDPTVKVRFTVVPQPSNRPQFIQIDLHHKTVIFQRNSLWKPSDICKWITKHTQSVNVFWFTPNTSNGTPISTDLGRIIRTGPTILLFTPRNPYNFVESDIYNAFKIAAIDYIRTCTDANNENDRLLNERRDAIIALRKAVYVNQIELKQICYQFQNNTNRRERDRAEPLEEVQRLRHLRKRNECQLFVAGQKYMHSLQQFLKDTEFQNNITTENRMLCNWAEGRSSSENRTLTTFVAVDSLNYAQFSLRLGVNVTHKRDKTAVVIVDGQLDSHFIMYEDFSAFTLRTFIYNFTNGLLQRHLTPPLDEIPIASSRKPYENGILVETVMNSSRFELLISQPDQVTLVYYVSKHCAFCSGISHIYLTVADILLKRPRNNSTVFRFIRVDGDHVPLPWQYTVEKYPTILLFIRDSYQNTTTENYVFPHENLPVTVPNLFSFIVANLHSAALKVETMWRACQFFKLARVKYSCIRMVIEEISSQIAQLRSELEQFPTMYVAESLRDFQRVHWLLKQLQFSGESSHRNFQGNYYDFSSSSRNESSINWEIENLLMHKSHS